ncbi:hypothetical protein [Streptomyces sp. ME19-01-6]|uniref:hypothetical protein n=1 Tax=Streptomyces sp. ME19-01-6 TaxID=3028686 RepID=UPI0029A8DF06|nr:hypothetical protein [Streptomyces sp. ME19-01-6]MDX3232947.1 hypothetical protein [Streptomyces sp. ME19-01-6]
MSIMTMEERGDMVEELLPVAAHLAVLVHGDGGPRDVHQAIARLSPAQRDALIVILAGLVDPDRPMGAVLGWLDFNEHGESIVPEWNDKATLRAVADQEQPEDNWDGIDHVAVDRWLRGRPVTLTRAERVAATLEGLRRGMTYRDMDELTRVKSGTTYQFILRERKAAAARGEQLPGDVPAETPRRFTEPEVIDMRERSAAGESDLELGLAFGVASQTVDRIVRGVHYPEYGGPVRAKKCGRPSESSRVLFNGATPGFAIAS